MAGKQSLSMGPHVHCQSTNVNIRSSIRAPWLLFALATGLYGCAEILDIPDDPKVDPRLAAEPATRCAPRAPATVSNPESKIWIKVCNYVDSSCKTTFSGLAAKVCYRRDIKCANPIKSVQQEANGEFRFTVPTGFDGYIRIVSSVANCTDRNAFPMSGGGDLCSLAPDCDVSNPTKGKECDVPTVTQGLWFFNPPVTADLTEPLRLNLLPTDVLSAFALVITDNPYNTKNGVVVATLIDECSLPQRVPVEGMRVILDAPEAEHASIRYSRTGLTLSSTTETDSSGEASITNVKAPAFFNLRAIRQDETGMLARVAETAETGGYAEPGTITFVTVVVPK